MTERIFGVVLAGCGRISASHLRAIAELPDRFRLIAAVDTSAERAEAAAAPLGGIGLASLDEALALPGVDCVILCTGGYSNVFFLSTNAMAPYGMFSGTAHETVIELARKQMEERDTNESNITARY